MSANDSCHTDYNTSSYLAGLIDGQKIRNLISPVFTNEYDNRTAIRSFYYGIFQPCTEACKSPETLDFWKKLHEDEEALISTLSPEQCAIFRKISERVTQGVDYSMADSFIFGFQTGGKLFRMLSD